MEKMLISLTAWWQVRDPDNATLIVLGFALGYLLHAGTGDQCSLSLGQFVGPLTIEGL